jgi:hypothetical protein
MNTELIAILDGREARRVARDARGRLICGIEGQKVGSLTELRKALNRPRPRVKRFSIVRGSEPVEL